MLRNKILVGFVAAAALGLSALGASARVGGVGGGGFHGGAAFHGAGAFHPGGMHAGGFHGFRDGAHRHFHGRNFAFYGPYVYGAYDEDDCYWRGRHWVCPDY